MICSRCLYDDTIPGITFDADGVCSYCHIHDRMDAQYPTGSEGWGILLDAAERIKRQQHGKIFDVIVGISGGCDSSYTLHIAHSLGLRILAVHFDNGWNTQTADDNMAAMTKALGVPLRRYRVNLAEFNGIWRAFLLSGTRDAEAVTDIALVGALYRFAEQVGVRQHWNGHSFRTEGIAPLGWSYQDGRYIADVNRRHGGPRLETYPNLWLKDFLRWSLKGIQQFRPLYYVDYRKEQAKQLLNSLYGWQWYGGHHRESEITDFFMWLAYHRWGIDFRLLGCSALIRSGQMSRAEGMAAVEDEPAIDDELLTRVQSRLGLSDEMWAQILTLPKRTDTDYRTYKHTFELTRPLWWALHKLGRVPTSFYVKYCK